MGKSRDSSVSSRADSLSFTLVFFLLWALFCVLNKLKVVGSCLMSLLSQLRESQWKNIIFFPSGNALMLPGQKVPCLLFYLFIYVFIFGHNTQNLS